MKPYKAVNEEWLARESKEGKFDGQGAGFRRRLVRVKSGERRREERQAVGGRDHSGYAESKGKMNETYEHCSIV